MIGTIFLQEKDEGTKCQDNAKSVWKRIDSYLYLG